MSSELGRFGDGARPIEDMPKVDTPSGKSLGRTPVENPGIAGDGPGKHEIGSGGGTAGEESEERILAEIIDLETTAKRRAPIITSIRELPSQGKSIKIATPREIVLSERNKHVPFPELDKQDGSLEKLVLDTAEGKFPPHDQLPDEIIAGNIETYANWISELTEKDTQSAERGAVLHVPASSERIIFPSDPDVGDKNSCSWELAEERDKIIPTFNTHSHPNDICHSSAIADLGILISGCNEDDFVPHGMLIATPGHNYLMIKTQETPADAQKWMISMWARRASIGHDLGDFRRYGTPIGQTMNTSDYWELYKRAERQTMGPEHGFEEYYKNFIDALNISKSYHLGFYRSNKDGVYRRFTRPQVIEHMSGFLNTALDKARKN